MAYEANPSESNQAAFLLAQEEFHLAQGAAEATWQQDVANAGSQFDTNTDNAFSALDSNCNAASATANSSIVQADSNSQAAEAAARATYETTESQAWNQYLSVSDSAWATFQGQIAIVGSQVLANIDIAISQYNAAVGNATADWHSGEADAWAAELAAQAAAPNGQFLVVARITDPPAAAEPPTVDSFGPPGQVLAGGPQLVMLRITPSPPSSYWNFLEQKRAQAADLQAQADEKHYQALDLAQQLKSLNRERRYLREDAQRLTKELAEEQAKPVPNAVRVQALQNERNTINNQVTTATMQLNALLQQFNTAVNERDRLGAQAEAIRREYLRLPKLYGN
jgi:hypothetical protein